MSRDPRIDAYIAAAQPFAQPILTHLRATVHAACPEAEETIKWSFPHFDYRGRVMASMAAFKAHASFHLWRMAEAGDAAAGLDNGPGKSGMGDFGRLTNPADLPDDAALTALVKAAMAVIERGPAPRARGAARPALPVPAKLAEALAAAPAAQAVFDGFAPSHRYDYNEWIGEAKRPETRAKRVAQAIEWLTEGKPRHWKYQRPANG